MLSNDNLDELRVESINNNKGTGNNSKVSSNENQP